MSVTDTPIEPRAHVRGAHTASGDREPLSAASSLPGKGFDAQSKFVRSLTVYEARSFTPTKDPSTLVTAVIDREVMGPACGHSAVGSGQNHELSQHAASSGQRAGPKPPLAGGLLWLSSLTVSHCSSPLPGPQRSGIPALIHPPCCGCRGTQTQRLLMLLRALPCLPITLRVRSTPVPLLNRLRFQLFDFSVPCTHCLLPLASHPEFRCVHS